MSNMKISEVKPKKTLNDSKTYKLFKLKKLDIDLLSVINDLNDEYGYSLKLSRYSDIIKNKTKIEKDFLNDYIETYFLWDKRYTEFRTGLDWFYNDNKLENLELKENLKNGEILTKKEVSIEEISEVNGEFIDATIVIQRKTKLGIETYVYVFKGKNYFPEKMIDIEFPQKIYKKIKVSVVNAQKVVSPNDELSTIEARTKGRAKSTISAIGQFVSKVTFRTSWEPYGNKNDKRWIAKIVDDLMSESATIDKYFHSSIIGEPKIINLLFILEFLNDDILKRKDKNTDTVFIHPISDEDEIVKLWKEVLSRTSELDENLTLNWKHIVSKGINYVGGISKSKKYSSFNHKNIMQNFEFVENTSSIINYLESLNKNLPAEDEIENFLNHYINLPTAKVFNNDKTFNEKISIGSLFDIWDFVFSDESYYFWEGKWFLNDETYTIIAKKIMNDEVKNGNIILSDSPAIWFEGWDEEHFNMKASTMSANHYCIDRKLTNNDGYGFEVGDLLIEYDENEYELVAVKKSKTLGGANYVFDQAKLSLNHNHLFGKISKLISSDAKISRYSVWIYTENKPDLKRVKSLSFLVGISTFALLAPQRGIDFKVYISQIKKRKPGDNVQSMAEIKRNYNSFLNNSTLPKRIKHREIVNVINEE